MYDEINCITHNFIKKKFYRTKPSLAFKAVNKKEFLSWRRALKDKVKELLGEWPRPADLKPDLRSREEKGKYIREKWVIQTEKDCFMPLYLLIPRGIKGKIPAILCCHGHGNYGKDSVAGVTFNQGDRENNILTHNYNYGEQMAEHGFVAICPDWRSFGERAAYVNPYAPVDICNFQFLQHLILGGTLLGANVFDAMRAIDFLLTRKEVDGNRIGCMGLSFGGTMTTYTTFCDERIKAADIICYATSTEHYTIDHANTCGSQLVPHLYKYADVGDVMAAIAPRPLLIESGANDTCFYLDSARKAHNILKKAYKAAGAEENLWIEVFPGEHSFSGRKAFEFFRKHL
jgi:dienelactone hydrolase